MPSSFLPISRRHSVIAWALALFFVAGGLGNLFPPARIVADYDRWGYPEWFHYVTASLELATASLIARRATRTIGLILGGCVMFSALATLLLHAEFVHAIMPVLVLIALGLCFSWRRTG